MLLPYSTARERKDFPVMTVILLMLQVAMFIPNFFPQHIDSFFQEFGFLPVAPTFYGAVTYAFLHDGIFHFLGNALYLWVFGTHVEDAIGPLWFLLLYAVSSFAALVSHIAFTAALSPGGLAMPLVGASGAISGLLGLYIVRFWRTKVNIAYFFFAGIRPFWGKFAMRGVYVLGIWFGLQVVNAFLDPAGGVAYFAHIGPFIFGIGLGFFQALHEEGTHENLLFEAKEMAESGYSKSAAASLQDVLRREPDNTEALLSMAKVCKDNPKYGDPADYYRRTAESFLKQGKAEDAAKVYLETMNVDIAYTSAVLFKIAQALEGMNNFTGSVSVYERILRSGAGEDAEPALFHQCRVLFGRLSDAKQSVAKLAQFLNQFPDSAFKVQAEEMYGQAQKMAQESSGAQT